MKHGQWLGVVVCPLAFAALARPAMSQVPALRHSAPFLGTDLELRVGGAPPGALVVLFRSALPGHVSTPFGVLELDRATMARVGAAHAGAGGECGFTWNVPLDPLLAEEAEHFQAFVRTPLIGGVVLSQAVHLRLLGARAYVSSDGSLDEPFVEPGSLSIVSLTKSELVARIDFGQVTISGQPVFDASFAHGAFVSDQGLVVFDPFFGGVLAASALPPVSRTLLTDASSSRAFALEPGDVAAGQPAFVHVIELASGLVTSSVQLPVSRYTGQWIANLDRTMAYVVGRDDAAAQLFVERFDLTNLVHLGRVPIGLAGLDEVLSLTAAAHTVFIQSQRSLWPICSNEEALSQIDETAGAPSVTTTLWGGGPTGVRHIVAAPWAGTFAFLLHDACGPSGEAALALLRAPTGVSRNIPNIAAEPGGIVPTRDGVWVSYHGDSQNVLSFAPYSDLVGHAWSFWQPGDVYYDHHIVGIGAAEDALGKLGCAAVEQFYVTPTYPSFEARLFIVDRSTVIVTHVDLGPNPRPPFVVPVP